MFPPENCNDQAGETGRKRRERREKEAKCFSSTAALVLLVEQCGNVVPQQHRVHGPEGKEGKKPKEIESPDVTFCSS